MTDITLEQRAAALVAKWRATADGFDTLGGDISRAEAASMRNDANELEAALRLSVGADWVLVPVEFTCGMMAAFREDFETPPTRLEVAEFGRRYRAMLAAAPRHEPGEGS